VILTFHVPGQPATKGSGTPYFDERINKYRVKQSSKRLAPWEKSIATLTKAALVRAGLAPRDEAAAIPEGPVVMRLLFWLDRPKAHFIGGDGQRLRATAPQLHAKKLDLDKLARAVGDALVKARLLGDDGQIARIEAEKRWADPARGPGVRIEIETLNDKREVA